MTLVAPKKHHPTHKKRNGEHQRRHKQFHKTYWPYLPLFMVLAVGLACNAVWSGSYGVLGVVSDISRSALLSDTNLQRQVDNEGLLTVNDQLSRAAQAKADDMVARNYWSHDAPDGQTPWSFIAAAGYSYQIAGENLAYGFDSADAAVTAWMNSPEHRANILNAGYSQVGFGLASSPNFQGGGPATVIVAMYGAPATAAAAPLVQSTTPAAVKNIDNISQPVSRVQLLSGEPWSMMAVLLIAAVAGAIVILRHVRFWHRMLVKSEAFVVDHPLLDVAVLAIGMVAFVLGQSAGFIQ